MEENKGIKAKNSNLKNFGNRMNDNRKLKVHSGKRWDFCKIIRNWRTEYVCTTKGIHVFEKSLTNYDEHVFDFDFFLQEIIFKGYKKFFERIKRTLNTLTQVIQLGAKYSTVVRAHNKFVGFLVLHGPWRVVGLGQGNAVPPR